MTASMKAEERTLLSIRRHIAAGIAAVLAVVVGFGGWAATSELSGAVIATGTVVVDSNVKKVQHPTGGIVGEIRVRDGDKVKANDLLVRLDETLMRANLQIITKQLDELAMRLSRLKAERDGLGTLPVPAFLQERAGDPAVKEILEGETLLFQSRRAGREGLRAQLRERIIQLRNEAEGLSAQAAAKAEEIRIVKIELEGQKDLWAKKLIAITKFTQIQRDAARLLGEKEQVSASIAQARGKIAETELQILQIDQELRTEVSKDIREAQAKEAELNERRIAAEDQLRRVDIRAPQDGIVHQLAVHTVGGVVTQSEPIMLIVPGGDDLVIEAKIAPQDIDQVFPGQEANIRFPAFSQRTTPEVPAVIQRISADLTRDQQQNQAYYVVRLTINPANLERAGGLRLVPGMPAEVHIKTSERTALSYLAKPLLDQITRGFRER